MISFLIALAAGALIFMLGMLLEQIYHVWASSEKRKPLHPLVAKVVDKLNQEPSNWTLIDQDLWYNHDLGSIYIQKAYLDPLRNTWTLWVDSLPLPFDALTGPERLAVLAGLEQVRDALSYREAQKILAGLKAGELQDP